MLGASDEQVVAFESSRGFKAELFFLMGCFFHLRIIGIGSKNITWQQRSLLNFLENPETP